MSHGWMSYTAKWMDIGSSNLDLEQRGLHSLSSARTKQDFNSVPVIPRLKFPTRKHTW